MKTICKVAGAVAILFLISIAPYLSEKLVPEAQAARGRGAAFAGGPGVDPGINQPGAAGNVGRDPGINQPGAAGNVGAGPGVDPGRNQPGAAGNVGRDPGINQPGAAGNIRR